MFLYPAPGTCYWRQGTDYPYRKEWIRQRIEKLASVFRTDVLVYEIVFNHLHVVLRSRPDVVATWESLASHPERMAVIRLR
jgi:hypothetical protein